MSVVGLTTWEFTPFALVVLVVVLAVAIWYVQAVWALSARGRRWSPRRTVSFMAGLVAIDLALQSPVATLTMQYFEAHVVQHLLLMVIGPPLLAMGAPMTLALQTSSRKTKTRLLAGLHSRPFRLLTHPLTVAVLYYGSMFAFFLTSLLAVAMEHMWLMDIINIGFFLGSTLFWWPIVGLDPIPHWRLGYGAKMVALLIGVPLESFLALSLLSDSTTAAPMYSLASTHSGAGLLWIGAELFTMIALIPVFLQWLKSEQRATARLDAQLDAELAASGRDTTLMVDPRR